ncbi:DMT family transporter [Heyndrickxia acidicola]|uniref:DMT family transporter n=1 Tax=Heyndrickxia acidicola TaxID=209389 RepID=A0ABU6MMZ8_9BACI|nr:DMT family transporter [Heyndrickxia acidicola]MED1205356.1 DMT family transporter [Heyndrickxia acidicola]
MNKGKIYECLLLFIAFVWGATFVIVQKVVAAIPPLTFNSIRFFLAGLAMLLIYSLYEKNKPPFSWKSLLSGIILGFCLFIGYSFQTIGLLYTTPAKAGFITGLSVVMVPLISFLLFKRRPSGIAVLGSILAAGGLYLLTAANVSLFSLGNFLMLICAIGFAFHIALTDRAAKNNNVYFITTVQIFTVSFLCGIGAISFEKWQHAFHYENISTLEVLFAFATTAFIGTAAAFLIQTISQRHTSPTRVGIILTMEPVFAAITSYLCIGETLTLSGLLGCIMIFLGMMISELQGFIKKSRKKAINEKKAV